MGFSSTASGLPCPASAPAAWLTAPENPLFARVYGWYFFHVLPRVGRLLSGSPIDAYRYLPESVWAFPGPDLLASALRASGFDVLAQRRHLGGAVLLHVAERRA